MKKLTKLFLAGTAMLGLAMIGQAQAEPDYPFAATAHIGAGGWFTDTETSGNVVIFGDSERDIARIIGGGDFVIPVNGYWNVQLGGGVDVEHSHGNGRSFTRTQGHINTLGFWRNPDMGVFGLELGILGGAFDGDQLKYLKAGGVAEYFFGEMGTFGAFGGALVPFGRGLEAFDTGFYAGGHATYYASQNFALAAFASYSSESVSFGLSTDESEYLTVGGKVRYLTSLPGVEVYASGAYAKCEFTQGGFLFPAQIRSEGAEILAGVQIRLGGHTDSLVSIDRSNAIDTHIKTCGLD